MVDADRWQRNELIGQLPEVRGIDIELDMPTRNVVNPAGERVQFVDGLGPTAIEIEPDRTDSGGIKIAYLRVRSRRGQLGDPDKTGPQPRQRFPQIPLVEPLE